MLQATRTSTPQVLENLLTVPLQSESCSSENVKLLLCLLSFPFLLLLGQLSTSVWCQAHSYQCQMLQVHELQTHRNGHTGSNTVTIQYSSVTGKEWPNFLEEMPQKADMHYLPAQVPHSKQQEIALKCTVKPEVTSQPPLQGAGYPTDRRNAACWGRMLSHPPYRHKQLYGQKPWVFTTLSHWFVYMFLPCLSPLEQNPFPSPKNPEQL